MTTACPTRKKARRTAQKMNRRLAASTRRRVRYVAGSYGCLGGGAWCVWRQVKFRGAWEVVGAVDKRRW